mmetsp:Transcript_107916/g.232450  ORF Transcript_107916/g.232450 Transcript_107916/m.232450 type:complete len:261 (+) Transcript_107916:1174-1956(+)
MVAASRPAPVWCINLGLERRVAAIRHHSAAPAQSPLTNLCGGGRQRSGHAGRADAARLGQRRRAAQALLEPGPAPVSSDRGSGCGSLRTRRHVAAADRGVESLEPGRERRCCWACLNGDAGEAGGKAAPRGDTARPDAAPQALLRPRPVRTGRPVQRPRSRGSSSGEAPARRQGRARQGAGAPIGIGPPVGPPRAAGPRRRPHAETSRMGPSDQVTRRFIAAGWRPGRHGAQAPVNHFSALGADCQPPRGACQALGICCI